MTESNGGNDAAAMEVVNHQDKVEEIEQMLVYMQVHEGAIRKDVETLRAIIKEQQNQQDIMLELMIKKKSMEVMADKIVDLEKRSMSTT